MAALPASGTTTNGSRLVDERRDDHEAEPTHPTTPVIPAEPTTPAIPPLGSTEATPAPAPPPHGPPWAPPDVPPAWVPGPSQVEPAAWPAPPPPLWGPRTPPFGVTASGGPDPGEATAPVLGEPGAPWGAGPGTPWGAVPAGGAGPGGSDGPSTGRRRWRELAVVAVVAAIVGAATGAGVAVLADPTSSSAIPAGTRAPAVDTGQQPGPALAGGASVPAIVQKVLPEVVSIDATSTSTGGGLFGAGTGQEAQGTGMIYSPSGLVLTNNHVIAGADTITVTLYGQTKALPATLVGTSVTEDVALLKITNPPANLPQITFGDSTKLQVGDAVIAIGNALGLSAGTPTVTTGIVSALGRTVQAGDQSTGATETLQNLIQTDAAINPGNSGGPLVDSAGDVIAMNTAVATAGGASSAQNIGFAIPESTLQGLIPKLPSLGTTPSSNAFMGVEVADVSAQIRQAYNLTPTAGALVVQVVPGSPANSAGLQAGDVIVAYDGRAIRSAQDLTSAVHGGQPGQSVKLDVYRGSVRRVVTLTLAARGG